MVELVVAGAVLGGALVVLGGLAKVALVGVKVLLALLLLPLHLIGVVVAVVGGTLAIPALVLAAALVVLGLVFGLVLAPLLPLALLVAAIIGVLRLLRPRHA